MSEPIRHPDGSLCWDSLRCGFDGYKCANYPAAHPADSAESLLRERLDQARQAANEASRTHEWPGGGWLQAFWAALQASAPSAAKHMLQSGNGCVTCSRRWSEHTPEERGEAPSPAAEPDLSLHPPDCNCPDCTAAYEKGLAAYASQTSEGTE